MTRPFSVALKQQMVARLTGVNAVSAAQLARETGITQQNLSRWLSEARNSPFGEAGQESVGMIKRVRKLERELTPKESALAEAATPDAPKPPSSIADYVRRSAANPGSKPVRSAAPRISRDKPIAPTR